MEKAHFEQAKLWLEGAKYIAEYRAAFFSKNDFEAMKRSAEKFLKIAEEIIN